MSYIRFGWGLFHVKGASDSYIIPTKDGITAYGLGDLGMTELLCEAIEEKWKNDKQFAEWFKKEVAKRLEVELREKPITIDQSIDILGSKIDAKTLMKFELEYCSICNQMTNHKDGKCLKCEEDD